MNTRASEIAAQCRAAFDAEGATPVEPAILQSAETLLDLYGEDIRARTYVTADPARGELMLRPDFTVPVALTHLALGAAQGRYSYAGPVFRRQETDPSRASEYIQVGFEIFGDTEAAKADARVFALFSQTLSAWPLQAVTGDMGILSAAVAGLPISAARQAALRRHLWRPRRFRALLDRYSGKTGISADRKALLAAADPMAQAGPDIGLRGRAEVLARLEALRADAAEPPLPADQVALIDAILSIRAPARAALEELSDIAVDLPALTPAVERFGQRLDALDARGIDTAALAFEASFGRTAMEYYDGFVFGFVSLDRPDLPPIATGGRFDALTARLSENGQPCPAIGGVVRPEILAQVETRP